MKARLFSSLIALSLTLCLSVSFTLPTVMAEPDAGGRHQAPFATPDVASASEHLTQANLALQSGKYQEALSAFDQALLADPTSWLTYYRRATAQLSLGRTSSALADFQSLLDLNPSFEKARLQRAKIYLKEGELDKAKAEMKQWQQIRKGKGADQAVPEGTALLAKIDKTTKNLAALAKMGKDVEKARSGGAKGKGKQMDDTKLDQCIKFAGEVLEVSPSHLDTRMMRANCQMLKGNIEDAMADWSRVVHLAPSPFLLRRLSSLSYFIVGTPGSQSHEAGLAHLKSCLHSDPDNKLCARAHRRLKNLEKSLKKARNFAQSSSYRAVISALKGGKVGGATVVQEIEKAIEQDSQVQEGEEEAVLPLDRQAAVDRSALLFEVYAMYCKAYSELNEVAKATEFCDKVLARDPDNVDAIVARADRLLNEERYEEAVRDYTKAFESSGHQDRAIHQKLTQAQKRLKLSQTKDYYKVLGVKRNDDLATIKKAYRKMARENHPDKGGSQEKMAQINEAWGVLGDEELRKRYDMGDDPNDPAGQHGGQGNPFAQGGSPFDMFFQQSGGFPGGGFPGGGFPGGGFRQGGFGGGGGQQFHFKFG
ncbi:hypothetical protein ACQY0O_002184 [Thecaphora frezii]|uniref:Tetratricopeptide repeat and J domain-containing co-chaperone DNJ1 n=1 Tax=Thecaphora frezii TaxID=1269715 RepID=A0A8T9MX37_9BASI|nr:DnaJ subfamily C member 3-like protein [Thecaphora frezii]